MRSADPRLQVLPSFRSRAKRRVAELSRLLVALQRTEAWDSPYIQQVQLEFRYLKHGLRTLVPSCPLTLDEQRYIVERLLPIIPESSASGEFVEPGIPLPELPQQGLGLVLNPLTGRIRGAAITPLLVTGEVLGVVPVGTMLVLLRDGQEIYRAPAVAGPYSFSDVTPGSVYIALLTNSVLRRQQVRPVYSPILVGNATSDTPPTLLLPFLQAFYPGLVNGVGRFTTTARRKRIIVAVPATTGMVTRITQPDDNDAEITEAFTFEDVLLDFGADGKVLYHVGRNHADYIGTFTFDLHVTV